ncbi:MAG TPA: hydantoinase/oxoprolinase family protein [Solirubrobacteraceae bacterium]|jgi:N-methylhydantoinase A
MLLGVDVGGTFTDAVLVRADSTLYTAKVPSTPAEQSRGVLEAVRTVLARAGAEAREVERFAHGMTVATNALLEGHAARTALVTTEGFTDIVELGRQARPHLYKLCLAAPPALAPPELRFGVPERMTPDGPLRLLDGYAARALVERLAEQTPEAVAVVLLHSYAYPEHERLLGELLAERLPAVHVSLSHELVGTFREYERAASTEVDAALSPLLGVYLRRLCSDADAMGLARPDVMQSSGGLTDATGAAAHAALTVLSGPAGGVRGAQLLAELAGERDLLCFDMGGTSCDVCLIEDGEVAETAAGIVAGRPLALAMLDIHTVGAGGGSIAWRDPGGALRVGPASAGAVPGPACYGRGGTLPTVTDANLLLGRLPGGNARVGDRTGEGTGGLAGEGAGGLAGGIELDRAAAERAVADLAVQLDLPVMRCAEGIVRVAEAEMLGALRVVSVQRGLDPRGLALLAFGGAGPLHAAALARELGMRRILCPRASGVLCALGLAAGAPRRDAARTVMLSGEQLGGERLARERDVLVRRACEALREAPARITIRYELRYRGQSFELAVAETDLPAAEDPAAHESSTAGAKGNGGSPSPAALREAFARAHEQRYGYRDEQTEVELVTIRISAWGTAPAIAPSSASSEPPTSTPCTIVLDGVEVQAQRLDGPLPPGTRVSGPALCALPESTLLVPAGWEGEVDEFGTIRLSDIGARR